MTACCWLCTTMVTLVFWIACTRSGCTCCHLHCLRCLQNAWATSWSNKNEIMNGNQGDHVTFVWSWRRSKQRLSFWRTFHPFIQHHNADAVHRRTLRSPDVTLRTQAGWYGLSGFEFPVAGQLCVQNVTHAFENACLQNVQPLYSTFNAPALWKTSQVWVSGAARQERFSIFFNFTKITLENIWILN